METCKLKSSQAIFHVQYFLETLHLIFEFSGFLMEVDMSAYKGKYTFRVQRGGGSEVKDWNVSMTLQANGMYEIIGYQSSVGFTRTPDYHEKGHFDHLPGEGRYVTLQFNSEDTQGDRGTYFCKTFLTGIIKNAIHSGLLRYSITFVF